MLLYRFQCAPDYDNIQTSGYSGCINEEGESCHGGGTALKHCKAIMGGGVSAPESPEGRPWMMPVMGGKGTSPKACMQMTWKACPAGRRGTGTVHMLTASANPTPAFLLHVYADENAKTQLRHTPAVGAL